MSGKGEMKTMNRFQHYKDYIDAFGFSQGMKIIWHGWLSHLTKDKTAYSIQLGPNWGGRRLYIRINSSDASLAKTLFSRQGGEYDFVKKIPGVENFKTIVDAGANVGYFSLIARTAAPEARLIAIEPDAGNYENYLRNISLGKMDRAIHAGLWNKSCNLGIRARETKDVGFVVFEDDEGDIPAVSLKDVMAQCGIEKIDLLKIDIEGSEYEVFDETADEWVEKVGVLIIELHNRIKPGCSDRVNSMMEKHGYIHRNVGENEMYIHKEAMGR